MNTKKALKKLKKKVEKVPNRSAEQLKQLGKAAASVAGGDEEVRREVIDISQQAMLSAVSELATPLNPVLSWFREGGELQFSASSSPSFRSAIKLPSSSNAKQTLVRVPLKSPACKRCPALNNGICKCAAKKFNIRA
ncbi:hypothetical protein BIT28_27100 [Photobacterium proteolyticum]|uniref:Uncharacterized protein n=1 Tax=Photobacterium proteolyticum TaxID=1903952 RepID=A0A1Q9G8C3_9GAMM|nr:hypothetical protein [Photobacterium proteolyticum]OLQ70489.1 hypothetical protein BIT28_27100 [Photobacterium proteolyticum]